MKKILVTGVSGFVGSHLALALAEQGNEVYGIIKPSTSRNIMGLKIFLHDTVLLTCDIIDYQAVSHTLKSVNPDVVIHLAALSPVRESFERPFSTVNANVLGTLNIAHSMLELPDFKKRKLIYASTAEVYGIQKINPIKEEAPHNPSSPYASTKSMTDSYLRMMTFVYGLNTTVMRSTNTYGRKLDTSFFIEYVISKMLNKETVYIGAPDSIRDYMYIDDHVNGYIKAIEHDGIKGQAFNLGWGKGYTNKEVAFKIADIIGFNKKNIILGEYPPNYPLRPIESDQPFIVLDNVKAKKMLEWEPKVKFDDGLMKTISFWKEKLKK